MSELSVSQSGPSSATPTREALPAVPVRTFSVTVEERRACIQGMVNDERSIVIHADPLTTKTATGTKTSMGFPVLIVSGWVGDPEDFAAKVAALLQEAQP